VSDLAIRASDAERDAIVVQLRSHLVAGRLTADEFADRIDETYRARTRDELALVLRELPEAPAPRSRRFRWPLSLAVFSHVKRRRPWRIARLHVAIAVFGAVTLDLRRADLAGTTVILALPVFGSVEVIVPPEMDASLGGLAVFGSHDEEGPDGTVHVGPRVHVFGLAAFASLTLRTRGRRPARELPVAGS
jgi:uncharacterized protein DUF1707